MLYVLSRTDAVVELVKAAVQHNSVVHVPDSLTFLLDVVPTARSGLNHACVIVDLATVPDAERLISFTKASPSIDHLPIVLYGTEQEHALMSDYVRYRATGLIVTPISARELSLVLSAVCEPAAEEKPHQA